MTEKGLQSFSIAQFRGFHLLFHQSKTALTAQAPLRAVRNLGLIAHIHHDIKVRYEESIVVFLPVHKEPNEHQSINESILVIPFDSSGTIVQEKKKKTNA